ncbi:hypothetical protein LS81_010985 [Helicobacter trogontum]|uniref:Uncharacterized protein n=1 Tax=Helicobacter trogontum TaxID=50960 RepID=A0A4U8RZS3_9HELI|nr:hypothetical protein [Helicobacter trogontum]TLD78756.1 hypothetical protein LS81_010985 [Helicobacter trogontum]
MNVIKKYFTLKRIVIFFGGIVFLILFLSGGSFQFLNPQYYKFQYLMNTQSGFYILDEKLYRETKNREFRLLSNGEYSLGFASNGYEIFYKYEQYDFQQVSSAITASKQHKRYYIDSMGVEHIISFEQKFRYTDYGIFLTGDEGAGFNLNIKQKLNFLSKDRTIMLKE